MTKKTRDEVLEYLKKNGGRKTVEELLVDFAKQVVSDLNAVEEEFYGPKEKIASWSSLGFTRRWAAEIVEFFSGKEGNEDLRYEQLRNAVFDLLSELRIDEKCLLTMSNGYAPDYPGAVDVEVGDAWKNPHCKVQLSQVVAKKLIDAGVLDHLKGIMKK